MLSFEAFTGINNVIPEKRLSGTDLLQARDVNIGITGEISRRAGFTEVSTDCHKNLHQGNGFKLATMGSRLVAIQPDGTRLALHESIGPERVWYCNLPDGRTTFTNGLVHGITDGLDCVDLTVPTPQSLGAVDQALGALDPGDYRYYLTYVRLSDRLEGPASSSAPVSLPNGGLRLDGLPERDGYAINVYLSSRDGDQAYLAGTTTANTFQFDGRNSELVLACRTLGAQAFPVGTFTAFWKGRLLVAQGNVLWASRPNALHLTNWRDFRAMPAAITAIQAVDDGIYVGTTEDLVWLGGATFEGLAYTETRRGAVVPGSGVSAPGKKLKFGDGAGNGTGMLCIAGGEVVAGFSGGQTTALTSNRYNTQATEVCATFREIDGIPQYIAIPQ